MDCLFDNVYDDSFDLGMESYIDNDYAMEMTDEQLRRKADLQAKLAKKHPELANTVDPRKHYSKGRLNDLEQSAKRVQSRGSLKYYDRALGRNTTRAERVQMHQAAAKGEYGNASAIMKRRVENAEAYANKYARRPKNFLGTVASESFNEGYLQALEDYGYFE